MENSDQSITLRAATAEDEEFLVQLFASTRPEEITALGANTAAARSFIEMQFTVQRRSYNACYPAAENQIIVINDEPIGRMLVDRTGDAIVLVDIALLENYRDRGIGSLLIRQLIGESVSRQKHVRLAVYKFNPAFRLYQRLGFVVSAEEGLYLKMEYSLAPTSI